MIEVSELRIWLEGQRILGPISGKFGQGVTLFTGRIQSGKTTILKALCGLIKPISGSIKVDDLDLSIRACRKEVQSRIGFVFQNDALFDSMDALTNVSLPLLRRGVRREDAEGQASQAMERVGLEGQEKQMPEQLSGGMRKRLGIARAIVANPRYLVADEPFAGLDMSTAERVSELLISLWKNRGGLVVATSNPDIMWLRSDQVIVMEQGEIVAHGAPGVIGDDERVRPLFRRLEQE